MKAIRVFNNNAVSTVMPDGREAIILGKGIGFHKRPGEEVDARLVEKVYYVQNEMQTKFLKILQDVEPNVMRAAERVLAMAENEGFRMSNQATISLIDHISFSIERFKKNITLPNLLLNETQLLYQKEYKLGRKALDIIEECCGVRLPEDEAGYIALHLVTISVDRNAAYEYLQFIKGSLDIVRETYSIALEQDSLATIRLTTHLKFLAQRIRQDSIWPEEDDEPMYRALLARDPRHSVCLERMEAFIRQITGHSINNQERFYILIHLTQLLRYGE
ncbi:MAG: PRD domain-containing protein [Firmicutes bacterium]|nr:PRD domain-containing protein [Bacillota bacterium]